MNWYTRTRFILLAAGLLCVASARVGTASWDPDGTPVCTATDWQGSPALVADGDGGVIIAWTDARVDTSADIYAQRLSGSGVPLWTTNGIVVCAALYGQDNPLIVSDGSGGAILIWVDGRSSGWSPSDQGDTDLYAQRLNADGVAQWDVGGVLVCAPPSRQWFPTAIPDGAGGVIITWSDQRNGVQNDDIYAQWLNGTGTRQWGDAGVVLCAAPGRQSIPTIATDGAGGAIVSWYDFRADPGLSDIYAQRVSSAGVALWTTDGVALCSAPTHESSPKTVSDMEGGAIVSWTDSRNGNGDQFAQRVNSLGITQWAPNGVAVCTAASNQAQCCAISDGEGGVIVAWVDPRNYALTRQDVYAQRLDSAGSPLWEVNGVPVSTATEIQFTLGLTSDGSGGAVITWVDARGHVQGYPYDIYAQRITGLGTAAWSSNGVPVCTNASFQFSPQVVNDASGVVLVWHDSRSGPDDIYARRLTLDGELPTAVYRTPSPDLSLSQNVPNPFSADTYLDIHTPSASQGTLYVYDVRGRTVAHRQLPGLHVGWQTLRFDGRDDRGRDLPSGVYFLRVSTSAGSGTRKIVIQH